MRGEDILSVREQYLESIKDRNCGTCCVNHDLCDPNFLGCNSATGYPMWQRGKHRANTKEKLPTAHNIGGGNEMY